MCGIAAVYGFDHSKDVAPLLYQMLLSQSNRMNYSAGITVFDDKRENDWLIAEDRGLGPIDTAFGLEEERKVRLAKLEGYMGIGHGRYATSNANKHFSERQKKAMAQPYYHNDDIKAKNFAIGYNGNVANFEQLYEELKSDDEGYHIRTDTDTEIIRIFFKKKISHILDKTKSRKLDELAFKDILEELSETFIGAYSLAFIDGTGNLLLARDKEGTRPLVYTVQNWGLLAASEPTAFNDQGIFENIQNLKPGHFLMINDENKISGQVQFAKSERRQCGFDPQYFSHVTSVYDGIKIQQFRQAQGVQLSYLDQETKFTLDDFVASAPETARPIANGYIEGCLQQNKKPPIPIEALVKHKHFRSFMEDDPENRMEKVRHKFRQTLGLLEGKRLYLLDDSIVRGNVTSGLVPLIKKVLRPAEIHLRIAWDVFQYPCFRGIDISNKSQLLAYRCQGDVERMGRYLGVDSLKFLPTETNRKLLSEHSPLSPEEFCMACADGNYPSEFEKELAGIS